MITEKKAANAMAGKTARACDSCLRKRARWFCAADDAFLCQACDASVHCANQLASRHQRVRLQTSSFKDNNRDGDSPPPAWQRGVTRKARTPRHKAKQAKDQGENSNLEKQLPVVPLVPEMSNEDDDKSLSYDHENELNDQEQLLYRVPVFDPFAAELCHPMVADDDHQITAELTVADHEEYGEGGSNNVTDHHRHHHHHHHHHHEVLGFLPSELELAEFAADVESLLGGGGGLEEEYSCDHEVKGFGIMELLDSKEEEEDIAKARVKVEEEDHAMLMEAGIGGGGEKFDYDGLLSVREGEEEGKVVINNQMEEDQKKMVKRDILLRLNYEAVIAAWASQGSPWTTGTRPEVNLDHGWPDYMDLCRTDNGHNPYGDHLRVGGSDVAGREARVSRYREKRRTRLFSKKIRYEVRKLNAEKRPRMKGRFVKRTSFMSTNSTTFHYSNQLIMKNNT